MATNNVTITAVTGPGITNTAKLYSNVTSLVFNYALGVILITYNDNNDIKTVTFQLSGITTVTYTISSGIATVVIS